MSRKTLLVEGSDDEHVIKHLCGTRGLPSIDAIKPLGGLDRLVESFEVHIKAGEEGDALGVLVDADDDLNARWQAIRDRIVKAQYPRVPGRPPVEGLVIEAPAGTLLPRVGVWIMPDNSIGGILEDFLRYLIPADSALFRHVEASVATIPAGEVRFTQTTVPKVLIHTWLSWQAEPGKPLGTAITARYLDPGVPQVDSLISWLNRLFFA